MKRVVVFSFLLLLCGRAFALAPDAALKDPAQEARARAITRQLRCLVCQGEDIDESQAPLAADLRKLVRERIEKGDTDAQVLQFMRDRYGDYVLMNPPLTARTLLLWSAPALVFLTGLGVAIFFIRRQRGRA